MLVEKLYHHELLLIPHMYPEYTWIPEFFIGNKRPKAIGVIDKLKSLGWKITHQTMNTADWLITFEKEV
jgi:hypothetical protein